MTNGHSSLTPNCAPMTMHDRAVNFFQQLQDRICAGLEKTDGTATFREDAWTRPAGVAGARA